MTVNPNRTVSLRKGNAEIFVCSVSGRAWPEILEKVNPNFTVSLSNFSLFDNSMEAVCFI